MLKGFVRSAAWFRQALHWLQSRVRDWEVSMLVTAFMTVLIHPHKDMMWAKRQGGRQIEAHFLTHAKLNSFDLTPLVQFPCLKIGVVASVGPGETVRVTGAQCWHPGSQTHYNLHPVASGPGLPGDHVGRYQGILWCNLQDISHYLDIFLGLMINF